MMEAASRPVHSLKVWPIQGMCSSSTNPSSAGSESQFSAHLLWSTPRLPSVIPCSLAGERVGLHPNLLDSESVVFDVLAQMLGISQPR